MTKAEQAVGQTFGRLSVLRPTRKRYVSCRCECGVIKEIDVYDLLSGKTRSCGCLHREVSAERAYKHGDRWERLYFVWLNMRRRCYDFKNEQYADYGGRGIRVCSEWNSDYSRFRQWALQNGYSEDLQIDRIDNDADYRPDNCRFVTPSLNCRNKRNSSRVTIFGETKTYAEWAEDPRCCVSAVVLRGRIASLGWEPEVAVMVPKMR